MCGTLPDSSSLSTIRTHLALRRDRSAISRTVKVSVTLYPHRTSTQPLSDSILDQLQSFVGYVVAGDWHRRQRRSTGVGVLTRTAALRLFLVQLSGFVGVRHSHRTHNLRFLSRLTIWIRMALQDEAPATTFSSPSSSFFAKLTIQRCSWRNMVRNSPTLSQPCMEGVLLARTFLVRFEVRTHRLLHNPEAPSNHVFLC